MEGIKSLFKSAKPEEPEFKLEPSDYEEDMRALVLAHIFINNIENKDVDDAIKGKYGYYYRKMRGLRKILLLMIVIIFLMQKPHWCVELGDDIDDECAVDSEGREYNLLINTFIDPGVAFVISYAMMYFLIVLQVFKVQSSDMEDTYEIVKMYGQIILFSLGLVFTMMESFGFMEKSDFTNMFKIMFIMIYFRSVLKALGKIGEMFKLSTSMLIMLLVDLCVFSILARVIFEGIEIGGDGIIYGYSFTSYFRSLNSMFLLILMENFPDILIEALQINPIYFIFFLIFILTSSIIVMALVTGVFYFHYKNFYVDNIQYVEAKYPIFKKALPPLMDERYLEPSAATDIMNLIEREKNTLNDDDKIKKIRASYKAKLRRAMKKIKELKKREAGGAFSKVREVYFLLQTKFFYKFLVFFGSFYITFTPIMAIDRANINNVSDILQSSEFFAFIFALDFYFSYTFNKQSNFWGFANICELASIIGVIIFANVLYLLPMHFKESYALGSYPLYMMWTFFCLLKFVRMHVILMGLVNYRIIIKTCIHIVPLIIDLLGIYMIIVLFYATVGMYLFGGIMNTGYPEVFEELSGEGLGEEAIRLHFNDLINACFYLVMSNLVGYLDLIHQGTVTVKTYSESETKYFLTLMYFYSYLVVTEFVIIAVIIGFIIDFLGLYQENVADLAEEEIKIAAQQNFIDVLLDRNNELPVEPEEENEDEKKLAEEAEDEDEEDDVVSDDSVLRDVSSIAADDN